jgi:hypothetical protein
MELLDMDASLERLNEKIKDDSWLDVLKNNTMLMMELTEKQ